MGDELKPCPFCGQMPRNDSTHLPYLLAHCTNQDCVGSWMTVGAGGNKYHWNTRPLEDALQAEVDRLTAIIHKAEWDYPINDSYRVCPVCDNDYLSGHSPDCPFYKWEGGE